MFLIDLAILTLFSIPALNTISNNKEIYYFLTKFNNLYYKNNNKKIVNLENYKTQK